MVYTKYMYCGTSVLTSKYEARIHKFFFLFMLVQAEASPGELVGLNLVAAPAIDTVSSPQVKERTKVR